MNAAHQLLTDHIDIWSAADAGKKSGRGRASGNAGSVYGIRKLRELILELAVRGKLAPQDANDEPASALLKRIQAKRSKLIAEGKIKKDKPLRPINEEEKPFELPQSWAWGRLASIGITSTGRTPSTQNSNLYSGSIPFIGPGQITLACELLSAEKWLSEAGRNETTIAKAGDILMVCIGGSIGKSAIADEEMAFNQQINCISLFCVESKFAHISMMSNSFQSKILEFATGSATPIINKSKWEELLVPVPPLAEQHRIVAKVDELMALCDQLETRHSNAAEAHEKLVSHLLATLTQSQNADDFSANWQRIAAHFDTLFSTETSIDALKQTLLQLAVMGKLVPQDPKDEPAGALLKRIQTEKAKLIAEGKIKKDKPLAAITEDEKPFALPNGWTWIRLGALVEKSGAGWSPSCEGHPRVENEWGVLKVSAVSWGKFLPDENKALPKTLEARLDCVVETGDFLVSRANTAELVARSVVVEECPQNLMLSDKIVRLRLSSLCDNRFINLANSSLFARSYYSLVAGGTSSSMKNVSREQILNLIVGKPPLAEQHRIVTKVNELMALCDRLKARITDASQLQQKLADVLVAQAVV